MKLEPIPEDLDLMLKLTLPLNRTFSPFLPESTSEWMAPKFWRSSLTMDPQKVTELMTALPSSIQTVLTSMPAGEPNEDPRIKLMHAAVYFQSFSTRFHKSQKVLEREEANKAEVKTTDEMNTKNYKENMDWANIVESSFINSMPAIWVEINLRFQI